MAEPITHEIVIRGNAGRRLLGALCDDFAIEAAGGGTTRLTGVIRDAAHLHGVVTHLTSLAIEIVSLSPLPPMSPNPQTNPKGSHDHHHPPTDE